MSESNGKAKPDRPLQGNFSPEVVAWMERRSAAIARALNRKGMPMVYGGKKRDP